MKYDINLTDAQGVALGSLSEELGKTPQEIINEQVAYYIKRMLINHYKKLTEGVNKKEGISDVEKAELAALRINAANLAEIDYLETIREPEQPDQPTG